MDEYPTYPMLCGLQKPLEFKGVRGRFLLWLAIVVGIAMFGTLILLTLTNALIGFSFLAIVVSSGYLFIRLKQKQGLHSKKKSRDILVYHNIFKIK